MKTSPLTGPLACGAAASAAALLVPRLFPLAALADLSGRPVEGWRLAYPLGYDMLAPLSMAADRLNLMSVGQLRASVVFVAGALALATLAAARKPLRQLDVEGVLKRGAAVLALAMSALAGFILWTVLAPRPAARLVALSPEPDSVVVDIHSHTSASWDGRSGFDGQANADWHRRQGFDAAFITDHNVFSEPPAAADFPLLRGEELSLDQMHLVVLGNRTRLDPASFGAGPVQLARAIKEARDSGFAVIPSLPEYWRNYSDKLDFLLKEGAHGFEVVNASPRALDFPESERGRVMELVRAQGLAAVCATDSHGWGSAVPCWNIARVADWRSLGRDRLETALVDAVREGGPEAVRPIFRARPSPQTVADFCVDPAAQLATALRTATSRQALFLGLWVFAAAWLFRNSSFEAGR